MNKMNNKKMNKMIKMNMNNKYQIIVKLTMINTNKCTTIMMKQLKVNK